MDAAVNVDNRSDVEHAEILWAVVYWGKTQIRGRSFIRWRHQPEFKTNYENRHSVKEGRKCLFNDTLNTFYLRLYGVRHMVKDHSESERGNQLPPHGLLFPINSKGYFICTIPDRIAQTMPFVKSVLGLWLEWEIFSICLPRGMDPKINHTMSGGSFTELTTPNYLLHTF